MWMGDSQGTGIAWMDRPRPRLGREVASRQPHPMDCARACAWVMCNTERLHSSRGPHLPYTHLKVYVAGELQGTVPGMVRTLQIEWGAEHKWPPGTHAVRVAVSTDDHRILADLAMLVHKV